MSEDSVKKFKDLNTAVIIPTYNNDKTLRDVLDRVLLFISDVIVINDGSGDKTSCVLEEYGTTIKVITHETNKGKGIALKNGIRYAYNNGYSYAISLDSDGQHFPEDLPTFVEKIKQNYGALIIGARNMEQDGIPGKSSFGNKFSNFWYMVETGYKMPDTQSGFRAYPLEELGKMKFITPKFEFEIEIIVRAAWKGINIDSVPVKVKYFKEGERVSHFRPFIDFTRISILNTFLVLFAFLWFRPVLFIRNLRKKSLKEILGSGESNIKLASATGFGVFMGIFPVWGYQMIIAATVAHLLKLNKVITLVASNISIPPMIPLIIFGSFKFGAWIVKNPVEIVFNRNIDLDLIKTGLIQYFAGSIFFAFVAGFLAFILSLFLLKSFRKRVD